MTTPITPICRQNVAALATAYIAASGLASSTISRMCHSDPAFLENFCKGKISVTLKKYDAIIAWFDRQDWPKGAKPDIHHPFPADEKSPTRTGRRFGTRRKG